MAQENRDIVTLSYKDHVRLRTGMYLGSTKPTEEEAWILSNEDKLEYKTVKYVPALAHTFIEVLDNSIDEGLKTDWKYSTKISVEITKDTCSVEDNGRGIPVKKNDAGEWMPVVALCNGMSGSNFNDDSRQSLGQNGTGAKCANYMSTYFECVTCDGKGKLKFVCKDHADSIKVTELAPTPKTGTKIIFKPDLNDFNVKEIDDVIISLIRTRLKFLSWFFPKCTFTLNGEKMTMKIKDMSSMFQAETVTYSNDKAYIAVYPTEEPYLITYLNGRILKSGTHADYIMTKVICDIRDKIIKKYKNIKPNDIRNRLGFVVFLKDFPNCSFTSQTKETLANSIAEVGEYIRSNDINLGEFTNKIIKNKEIINNITEMFRLKEELAEKKALDSLNKTKKEIKSEKYMPPVGKSGQKYLMITEGFSAFSGISPILGRQGIGYYMLRGKPMNILDEKPIKFMNNQEIKDLVQILGIDITNPDTDMTYDKVVVLSDADSDGTAIAGLCIAIFSRLAPKMLKDGRICRLETPLLFGSKGDKLEEYYFSFPDKKSMKKDLKYFYAKGLGSLTKNLMDQVLKKEGGMDKLIKSYEVDNKAITTINNWFREDASERKIALRGREFHIDKA